MVCGTSKCSGGRTPSLASTLSIVIVLPACCTYGARWPICPPWSWTRRSSPSSLSSSPSPWRLGSGGQEALAILGLFGYAGLRLQPSLKVITGGLNNLRFAAAPTADLHRDLQLMAQQSAQGKSAAPFPFEHELRLEGVCFRYEEADRDALTDVSFALKRGEQIGICGPTGGGKSTLVDSSWVCSPRALAAC